MSLVSLCCISSVQFLCIQFQHPSISFKTIVNRYICDKSHILNTEFSGDSGKIIKTEGGTATPSGEATPSK